MTTRRRTVRDPRELRALAHPIRIDLLERLLTDGPFTATKAAELTGESQASCSFHLRQLAQYGFVEPAEGGRGRERPWRLSARGLSWDSSTAPPEERAEFAAAGVEVSALLLDRATDAAARWFTNRLHEPDPWARLGEVTTAIRSLTAAELQQLTDGVLALLEPYLDVDVDEGATHPDDARRVRIAFVAVPDEPPA